MYQIKYTNQFKKDYKLIKKRGYDIDKLKEVIEMLANGITLPKQFKEHYLTGDYKRI